MTLLALIKLVVIVDVIDQNQPLVDFPDMVMTFKRLSLTDIKIDINMVPKKKTLIEAMEKADVKNKWESCSWGRKLIVQKRRAALNDFDTFKFMLAKSKILKNTIAGRRGGSGGNTNGDGSL